MSRDRGEGLIEGREAVVGFACGPRPAGWAAGPVKLQLSYSCAACPGMQVQVQLVSLETRRDERSEIDNKSKAKRVETSSSSPPGRGRLYVGRRQSTEFADCRRVHETVQ